MKILIIGSKGFIGSHCVSYFQQKNEDVWEADVMVDYANSNYRVIDTANSDFLELFQTQQFDVCINCSGAANVSDSFIHPSRDFSLNTINVFKMLDAIRRFNKNCKFVNLSSAAVYGNPKKLPIREDSMINPISPYGWHKQNAEFISKEYFVLYGIQTINLRIFSVYGRGLKKQIFWDIFQKTKKSDVVELFGIGNETRDFIYIDDLVKAIQVIIEQAQFDGGAINVASGVETTIRNAATLLCGYIKDNITIDFNHITKDGDPLNWKADIEKLSSYNFKCNYSMDTGLHVLSKWMKENN